MCLCACACACLYVCARARARACARMCVHNREQSSKIPTLVNTDPFYGVTWSNCSARCAGGMRSRQTKTNPTVTQEIACNMHSCDPGER